MLEEFQVFFKILVLNAERLKVVTKETNVDVRIEAKSNECPKKKENPTKKLK